LPSINALGAELSGEGFTVLLVDISESRDLVARTVSDRGYTARVLLDSTGQVADIYQVRGTPTTYLIGRDGLLLGGAVGPRPWTSPPGRALLHGLLSTPGPPPSR
jgi:AhpC/TSA family protein